MRKDIKRSYCTVDKVHPETVLLLSRRYDHLLNKEPVKVYGSLFKSPRFSMIFPRKPEACPLLIVNFL